MAGLVSFGIAMAAVLIPLAAEDSFNSMYLVVLYVIAIVAAAVVGVLLELRSLRVLAQAPDTKAKNVRVRWTRLHTLFHELQVVTDGEEFLLKVQGLRGNVIAALSRAGFPLPPVRWH